MARPKAESSPWNILNLLPSLSAKKGAISRELFITYPHQGDDKSSQNAIAIMHIATFCGIVLTLRLVGIATNR